MRTGPSQILGIEAVKDDEYFRETLEKIITTREHAKKKLESLGFEVTDSRANFLFASHPRAALHSVVRSVEYQYILYNGQPQPTAVYRSLMCLVHLIIALPYIRKVFLLNPFPVILHFNPHAVRGISPQSDDTITYAAIGLYFW